MKLKSFAIGMLGVLMAACFVASEAFSQDNHRGTSSLSLKEKTISVEYGRPSLKGRTVDKLLGKLPPGGIWRLGADTSATFKTEIDLAFSDVYPAPSPSSPGWHSNAIPAGEYSIWMQRLADNSWKLLFDKPHGQLGEPPPDASECFASVPLFISGPNTFNPHEMLTITLLPTHAWDYGGWITIQWGTLEAKAFFAPK
jgi:hypothetical protein